MILHVIALYYIVLHGIALYCTMWQRTLLHCIAPYAALQPTAMYCVIFTAYITALKDRLLYHTVSYFNLLCFYYLPFSLRCLCLYGLATNTLYCYMIIQVTFCHALVCNIQHWIVPSTALICKHRVMRIQRTLLLPLAPWRYDLVWRRCCAVTASAVSLLLITKPFNFVEEVAANSIAIGCFRNIDHMSIWANQSLVSTLADYHTNFSVW